jgi:hypothetical protein
MKTLTSIALAGALVAATASGASAGGWNGPGGWQRHGGPHHYPRPQHHVYQPAPDNGGALFAGAILGLTFGMIASQAFQQPEPYYAEPQFQEDYPPQFEQDYAAVDMDHVEWCAATYRSYNRDSDTWIDFQGVVRQCVEPN